MLGLRLPQCLDVHLRLGCGCLVDSHVCLWWGCSCRMCGRHSCVWGGRRSGIRSRKSGRRKVAATCGGKNRAISSYLPSNGLKGQWLLRAATRPRTLYISTNDRRSASIPSSTWLGPTTWTSQTCASKAIWESLCLYSTQALSWSHYTACYESRF